MRVVFMGTPDFSVPTLQGLIDHNYDVVGVVTQPDKARGRGKKVTFSPVKELALKYNMDVYQPTKMKNPEFINDLRLLKPDVIVVIAFGRILPKEILELPPLGCINVHASLLPKYRGAGPIQWSIINGEEKTGITTMYMDVGLDTGDMLFKDEVLIHSDETGGSLHDKLSVMGASTLIKTLKALEEGTITREKQVDEDATYAPMLSKEMGKIDWSKDAVEIERLVRGLNPWPSAYTYFNKKLLKLWKVEVIDYQKQDQFPSTILDIKCDALILQTGKGTLAIKELQLQGKKRMTTEAFLRGHEVEIGDTLGLR